MICYPDHTGTHSSVNGSVDCLQVYLADIRPIGLLSAREELAIGKRAFLFRNAFRSLVSKSVPALNFFLSLLSEVQGGKRRIDRVLTFPPNDHRQRQHFRNLLSSHFPTLQSLVQQRGSLSRDQRSSDLRKRLRRNHAKLVRLLGELQLRQRFYVEALGLLVLEAEPLIKTQPVRVPEEKNGRRELRRKAVQMLELHHEACEELVRGNLRLVVSVAKKFTEYGYSLDDLIQDGNGGLLRAAQKYDYRKGIRFSTYATWWIREAILGKLSDAVHVVAIPARHEATIRKLDKAHEYLLKEYGRSPRIEEMAGVAGVETRFAEKLIAKATQYSLDRPLQGRERESFRETLVETRMPAPSQVVIGKEQRKIVRSVLNSLNAREKEVIRLRFGLRDGQQRSLAEVGRELGLSRERVRQIYNAAVDKMLSSKRLVKAQA